MTNMKRLFAIALIGLTCIFAVQSQAQIYGVNTVINGGTNTTLLATNTYNVVLASGQAYREFGLLLSWKSHVAFGGGTPTVVFRFQESLDGTTWSTGIGTRSISMATNATTTVLVTNITLGAVGYLRLATIENTNSSVVTNLTVAVALKPGD